MIDRASRFVDIVTRCKSAAGLILLADKPDYIPTGKKHTDRRLVQNLTRREQYARALRRELSAYMHTETDVGTRIYLLRLLSMSDLLMQEAIDAIYAGHTRKSVAELHTIAENEQQRITRQRIEACFPHLS